LANLIIGEDGELERESGKSAFHGPAVVLPLSPVTGPFLHRRGTFEAREREIGISKRTKKRKKDDHVANSMRRWKLRFSPERTQ